MDEDLDDLDLKILDTLVDEGRVTMEEISQRIGLRRPSVSERVEALEKTGVIRGYHATLDPDAVGAPLVAYVLLTLGTRKDEDCASASARAAEALRGVPEVLEYHTIAGDHDALVKLRARDMRDLERLTTKVVSGAPGVARIRTLVALSTAFERPLRVTMRAATKRRTRRS